MFPETIVRFTIDGRMLSLNCIVHSKPTETKVLLRSPQRLQ